MKIYSWNILFKNRELDRVFAFIRDSEWDIFCLQEVPEEFLARLRALSVEVAAAPEADRNLDSGHSTQYVVILSRHPIQNVKPIPLPYHDSDQSLRGKMFGWMMSALGLWAKRLGNRHAILADIKTPKGIVRVFNLHLSLINPAVRLDEFEAAMSEHDLSQPTIVCGDFNIVEKPHITILNFLLGGSFGDAFFYSRERKNIEQVFATHQLVNPLRGKSTHPLSRSQLDHILVSKNFSIKKTEVLKDRIGSDHCPIRVDIS
jgi:endonuclease/exonuclease/phosphatase family metal-dependent hydrolase